MLFVLLILALLCGVVAFFGFFTVRKNCPVVVLRWGRHLQTLRKEGLYFRFPLGLDIVRVPAHRKVLELPAQTVMAGDGNLVRVRARLEYQVINPQMASMDVEDVDAFVEHHGIACARQAGSAFSGAQPDPASLQQALVEKVAQVGVVVYSSQLDCEGVVSEALRPAAVRHWVAAVIEAHRALQDAALASAQKVYDAAGSVSKTSRGEFLGLAAVHVDQVSARLADLVSSQECSE